jgi:hypothetical protein
MDTSQQEKKKWLSMCVCVCVCVLMEAIIGCQQSLLVVAINDSIIINYT